MKRPATKSVIQAATSSRVPFGHIDRYGYLPSLRAWLFWGWSPVGWEPGALRPDAVTIRYVDEAILPRRVRSVFFERPDLYGRGRGVCLLVPARRRHLDGPRLREIAVALPDGEAGVGVSLFPIDDVEILDEPTLRQRAREAIEHGISFSDASALLSLIGEAPPDRKTMADPGTAFRRGHVDYYGAAPSGGITSGGVTSGGVMLFCGWVPAPWEHDQAEEGQVRLTYERGCALGEPTIMLYRRTDIGESGVGMVLCMSNSDPRLGPLVSIEIQTSGMPAILHPTNAVEHLDDKTIVERVGAIIAAQQASNARTRLRAAIAGRGAETRTTLTPAGQQAATLAPGEPRPYGHIDFYGHLPETDGWIFVGWGPREWSRAGLAEDHATVKFLRGSLSGAARSLYFERSDIGVAGTGMIVSVIAQSAALGPLVCVELSLPDGQVSLYPSANAERVRGSAMVARGQAIAQAAPSEHARVQLLDMLTNHGYSGNETLSELSDPIFFAVDQAIICQPAGVLILGWLLAPSDVVDHIIIRSGDRATEMPLDRSLRMPRRDVAETIGRQHGISDPRCGFIAYLPDALTKGCTIFAEIRTKRGEIGFVGVPASKLRGMEAIRNILNVFALRHGEIAPVFDDVIGPGVASLVAEHTAERPTMTTYRFGAGPAQPHVSVIVPLYGRIDYLEYQLAFLSDDHSIYAHEFIYVLDDPERREETMQLAESVWQRFGVPFTLVSLSRNVGFAPANNAGLAHARGEYVCFLNSDVFPRRDGWLDRLAERLAADPTIGTVAPLLTFEDGTIQHAGMSYERLPEFGGWFFARHDRKGMRPDPGEHLFRRMAITGACMVMRRSVAVTLGGFDEAYAIGDFEDSDLCLRLRQSGLSCAVDMGVRLDHLERKSQSSGAEPWRMNLTLYNAWLHDQRWGARIAAGEFDVPSEAEQLTGEQGAAPRVLGPRPDKRRALAPIPRYSLRQDA